MFLSILAFSICSCDVDQTKEIELPEIDVEAGQLPAFDVDWADVNVGSTTKTITVPKMVVVMEEVEVSVPYIDIDMPDDAGEKEEMTLIVEAEVKNNMHNIKINEVHASNRNLYVISELIATEDKLENNQSIRVSDRVVLNAPDLEVKHYIIGKRPEGDHNKQYRYISSKNDIKTKLAKAKRIYKSK